MLTNWIQIGGGGKERGARGGVLMDSYNGV